MLGRGQIIKIGPRHIEQYIFQRFPTWWSTALSISILQSKEYVCFLVLPLYKLTEATCLFTYDWDNISLVQDHT